MEKTTVTRYCDSVVIMTTNGYQWWGTVITPAGESIEIFPQPAFLFFQREARRVTGYPLLEVNQ